MQNLKLKCSAVFLAGLVPAVVWPWGDQGHQVTGLIAAHYLQPSVLQQVNALLAQDTSGITATDLMHETTWADKYRDLNNRTLHYEQTKEWHFADIELANPNLDAACFQFPSLPSGTLASAGPAQDCVVNKINQFVAELKNPSTPVAERVMALQFLLHFVGDVHQPLHGSDNNDSGGNKEVVTAAGFTKQKLHHYWDTEFVQNLGGTDPNVVANTLIGSITDAQVQQWSAGTPSDWAQESFAAARDHAYVLPTPGADGTYTLSSAYVQDATQVVSIQLQKAGVRLAMILNDALGATNPIACTSSARAAAIPDLTRFNGLSNTAYETLSTSIASTWRAQTASSLPFDSTNPNGLQKSLEGYLAQNNWTLVEASAGSHSYVSRWKVAVPGCAAQTGTLDIVPSDNAGRYFVEAQIVGF
jgi:hypothetical protein